MVNKVKVLKKLGNISKTEKGFLRQMMVEDVSGECSVIKVFSKNLDSLEVKEGEALLVECQDFCFAR